MQVPDSDQLLVDDSMYLAALTEATLHAAGISGGRAAGLGQPGRKLGLKQPDRQLGLG